ncbi:MAG TPA: UDP-N-acetylglucosamine 2-epimerase (non-hydrolyzing) [Gemmatimonadales bacterium]|jgi:UDP-N-acetylglucosamine 2-epimerase (non-hydrolysing)|nr:UDP-N-acetylglucosamine 2-epimerase (non-hydrolyzing) [Gemmatimonadales bacterium]
MRLVSVVGARPNFVKLAPVDRALAPRPDVEHVIVHTGQHYDPEMSAAFFEELWIPAPDYNLGVGSGSHASQTAAVMERLEPVLARLRPDLVLVYGDANSTLAAALVAAKLGLPIGHVEAGLRSGQRTMPEEINRVVTDRLSDLLFTSSREASANVAAESIATERVHFVGSVTIDALCWALPQALARQVPARYGLPEGGYAVVTLHQPTNVDDPAVLGLLVGAFARLSGERTVVFPMHPRARKRLHQAGEAVDGAGDLRLLAPVGYLEMLGLIAGAAVVITDSGGLQEETTFLGVPCLTVRPTTERLVTCTHGTNRLVPRQGDAIVAAAERAIARRAPVRPLIERWDGHAAERLVGVVCDGAAWGVEAQDEAGVVGTLPPDALPDDPAAEAHGAPEEAFAGATQAR